MSAPAAYHPLFDGWMRDPRLLEPGLLTQGGQLGGWAAPVA
jgi:hypothetical protein